MKLGWKWVWGMACAAVLAWPVVGLAQTAPSAQEYVLGAEDVIAISVYLHPELERTLAVAADGNITFPPIGTIQSAGLTPKALGDRIAERLASYLRQTTSVTVTVSQYMSRSVYVQGAVARPGRYGFERLPGLIEVLGAAGGALPTANLGDVQIARREEAGRHTLHANVTAAMRDANAASLPALQPGDIITVPAGMGGGLAVPGDGVGVIGEVGRPGVYPVGAGQDLIAVLAVAGGATPRGDLRNVRVLTRDGATQTVVKFDLKRVLEQGDGRPPVLKAGDVVYVAPSGASSFAKAFGGFQALLGVSADVLNLIVLRRIIDDQNNP